MRIRTRALHGDEKYVWSSDFLLGSSFEDGADGHTKDISQYITYFKNSKNPF